MLARLALVLAALASPALAATQVQAVRFERNPILSADSVGDESAYNLDRPGQNTPFVSLAGPSLIRVPDWIEQPLGRYYLYFAHHKGGHIRLAYADRLKGPWTVHNPGQGVLRLADLRDLLEDHVASPDVHVDHGAKRLRMYVHGPQRGGGPQRSFLMESTDGLSFSRSSDEDLGAAYFRAFRWGGYWYTPARKGPLYRSRDGRTHFEAGPTLFPTPTRHYAVHVHRNRAYVFFSRIDALPERIQLVTIDLTEDWSQWTTSTPIDVLAPTEPYETSHGARLLDPCIYEEEGRFYLLYSVSAERGIAIARLSVPAWNELNVSAIQAQSCEPYRLADAPFGVGAQPFLDHPATVQAAPAALQGLPFLRTAHADGDSPEQAPFLRLRLSRPATLFVLHDRRLLARPAWLADWTDTGQSVDLGTPLGLAVLRREYPAGPVTLGGNRAGSTPFGAPRFNYSVLFQE